MSLSLVLIDWENISKGFVESEHPPETFSVSAAFDGLFDWINSETDEILDTFLFAPLYIVYTNYQLFYDQGLFPITCPRVPLGSPKSKDTVDEALIKRAERWITYPGLTHVCLVSGDRDFIPLLKEVKQKGLLIMISAIDPARAKNPEHPPLSRELSEMADISPKTGKKMIHYFSPIIR